MNETLRPGEVITKVTAKENEELRELTMELVAITDLLNNLVARQKAARGKLSLFWQKIGKDYFIDTKVPHHINFATQELRKGMSI